MLPVTLPASSRVYEFVHWEFGEESEAAKRGPKGAGRDWNEATSCTFGSCGGALGSASSAPCCRRCLFPRLCDLTARFLLSPRLLLEVRAQVCPFSYLFSGSQRVMGAQRSLAKGFPTKIWPASFSSLVFKSFSVRFGN